jgi:hypothetical protein
MPLADTKTVALRQSPEAEEATRIWAQFDEEQRLYFEFVLTIAELECDIPLPDPPKPPEIPRPVIPRLGPGTTFYVLAAPGRF